MRPCACRLLIAALTLSPWATAVAELPSADLTIEVVIDGEIDKSLAAAGVTGQASAQPEVLLRRMTLDLAGRIPTTSEQDWFRVLPDDSRTVQLVDRLMELPDFDFHLRNSLHELLMENHLYDGEFRDYLLWAVRQRQPWSRMFRDILLARESEGPENGAGRFLKSRVQEVDNLTNDTAVLFFGVNISCAKCHDHPLVADWKQDHFYGMQTFFSRTFVTRKNVLTERPFGEVRFKTTTGEDKPAAFMFLTGLTIEDKSPKYSDDDRKLVEAQFRKIEQDENAGFVSFPDFSPRRSLIDAALQDDTERYLARSIVNRTWARLMGQGIVDPHDQMHSGNPPSHPDLLNWLARDLATHDYDLRRLIRGIVLSKAYARSSESSGTELPAPSLFAVAQVRPLTPRQLAASLFVASRNPASWPAVGAADDWSRVRQDIENQADGWSREFEQPTASFQVAVDEALFFNNNERVPNDLLADAGDRLCGSLLANADDQVIAEALWKTVLVRSPSPDEQEAAIAWLTRNGVDRKESIRSLTWALFAGPEMRFNH